MNFESINRYSKNHFNKKQKNLECFHTHISILFDQKHYKPGCAVRLSVKNFIPDSPNSCVCVSVEESISSPNSPGASKWDPASLCDVTLQKYDLLCCRDFYQRIPGKKLTYFDLRIILLARKLLFSFVKVRPFQSK